MATIKGGEKTTRLLERLLEKMTPPAFLRVGFLAGATYPDGTSVAMIAAINEFGAPSRGQPPRPAFRNMVAEKRDGWPRALAINLKAENYDGKRALTLMGEGIAGQLRQSIADIQTPALAPSTIKRKGFDKPWIETGHLLQSVDFEVT